ncbi:ABC transporter substrate-binding protein [Oceanispirochaeta sp.]|jgi:ABC-type sugar transport system substrate-binding protein|uniref:ABC transporter substrate-binding protein n=1 Tax=Oceanispirochaeta sp. TaxID=2035350 RepID=UPI002636A1E8|nr:ABC transporter substrate-binding protein [Oceanispirochaeta sp.]MDA3958319.1 ABC transporter substrate-binding protein [Oceanispirochaeta sp.]
MKKRLVTFTMILMVLLMVLPSAFAKGATDDGGSKKMTVGFAQIKEDSPWRTTETNSVQQEAERLGIVLKLSVTDQAGQVAAIRDFITQKVDGILLAPQTRSGWDEVLQEAKNAGIPVVLLDRGVDAPESLWVTQISSDFAFEGREAAKWVAKKLDGKGKVVELFGDPAADPAILRNSGFMEVIDTYPGIEVVESKTGEWSQDKGRQVVEAWLAAGVDFDVVYAHNDGMALGAVEAMKSAGLTPGKDALIISIDAIKAAFEAIGRGDMNATVECSPLLGPLGFKSLIAATKGEPVDKYIITPDSLYDQDNYKNHPTMGF